MQIIQDRRALHRIAELGVDLPETVAYLKEALSGLNCRLLFPTRSAVCAWFDFGAEKTLAFRADMDALPIQERGNIEYASVHPGKMHACGHDGHMAILLELARRVSGWKELDRNILLVFQPAEETIGGAKPLCESGIFRQYGVEAIFGLHLWPGLTAGQIFSRKKELMARASEVNVDVCGKSVHIAKSRQGLDALAAGCSFYSRAMAMEAALPEETFRLLKFGKFSSGIVRNVLSAHTHMEGSLRAFQEEVFCHLCDGLHCLAAEVEQETGCTVTVDINEGYPAVINPEELYDRVKACVSFADLEEPMMTAEDFAWYQRYLPGIFFFLGTGDSPALHTDTFDFDETLLEKGADFFEELAKKFR